MQIISNKIIPKLKISDYSLKLFFLYFYLVENIYSGA